MKLKTKEWIFALGVGVVGFLLYKAYQGAKAVGGAVAEGANPTSNRNFIYRGINAVGDVLDDGGDNESFSLGSWLYDVFHPAENKQASAKGSDFNVYDTQQQEGIA